MKKSIKKILSLLLCTTLFIPALTGCSPKRPKDAKSLLIEVFKVKNQENFIAHIDSSINMTASINIMGQNVNISVPASVIMKAKVYDNKTAAIDFSASGSLKTTYVDKKDAKAEDEKFSKAAKLIVLKNDDSVVAYTKEDDSKWIKRESIVSEKNKADLKVNQEKIKNITKTLFENGEFADNKENYSLSIKLADIIKNKNVQEIIKENSNKEIKDDSYEKIAKIFKSATMVSTFNNEFRLTSCEFKGLSIEFSDIIKDIVKDYRKDIDLSNFIKEGSCSINLSIKFSDYGNVTKDDVKKPDKSEIEEFSENIDTSSSDSAS